MEYKATSDESQPSSFMEAFGGKPSGPMTAEQINAELDEAVARVNNLQTPVTLWSFQFDAEQLLAVYGALRIYLRTLAGQESEDLEMLARVVSILSAIRPRAVEASKSLALKSVSP